MFCSPPAGSGSHLSLYSRTALLWLRFALESSPTEFGFLACGVYRVPPHGFPMSCVTVTLSGPPPWLNALGIGPPSSLRMPSLIDWTGTDTTLITERASMDFPLVLYTSGCLSMRDLFFSILEDRIFQVGNTLEQLHILRAIGQWITWILFSCPFLAFQFNHLGS